MPDTTTSPDKSAIRAELEETRRRFHGLLESLSSEDWALPTANRKWNVRQMMWHLARGAGFLLQGVDHCRKGKGPNPPSFVLDPVNELITRIGAMRATPTSVAAKYDEAHQAWLACLDGIQDDEWQKSAAAYGAETTIEKCFHDVTAHFDEHEADIVHGLGRS